MASWHQRRRTDKPGLGIVFVILLLGFVLLMAAVRQDERELQPPSHSWPHFNCQEDEIMEWVDARHTAHCVNIEEFLAEEGVMPDAAHH